MRISNPPTLAEFEECREKLIKDIKIAENLYGEASELRTCRSGLKHIEEKIDLLRATAVVENE